MSENEGCLGSPGGGGSTCRCDRRVGAAVAVPSADVVLAHHPIHFWLVFAVAGLNVGSRRWWVSGAPPRRRAVAARVGASWVPRCSSGCMPWPPRGAGQRPQRWFALATPVAWWSGRCSSPLGAELPAHAGGGGARVGPWLRMSLYAFAAAWGFISMAGYPPLADPAIAEQQAAAGGVAVAAVAFYSLAPSGIPALPAPAVGDAAVILTAATLLAESMIAVALGPNWHLTWWL